MSDLNKDLEKINCDLLDSFSEKDKNENKQKIQKQVINSKIFFFILHLF